MNRKTMIATIALITVSAWPVSQAYGSTPDYSSQGCCKTMMHSSNKSTDATVESTINQNEQTAEIDITAKGFEPSTLKLKAGIPAKITFVRKTDDTCAKEVTIKEYKINRALPLNGPVTVDFTPRKGELTFTCGMNMLKGQLIVE